MFFWSTSTCILRIRRVELKQMRPKCSIWPIFGILKAHRGEGLLQTKILGVLKFENELAH